MKELKKNVTFFTVGGVGYGLIEVLWRGRTHWAMLIAGGICFILFSLIAEKFKTKSLLFKAALCSVSVTTIELGFGIIFNLLLKADIWDYSHIPLNFMGQICLLYTLLWGILGIIFIPLANVMNKKLG